jgi:chromatin segregation and condensation protein Rec8/ScpA/Scc1 (kleisin family)
MENNEDSENQKSSVNQEQIHDLLFNREIGWQEIIYDLINTEQLNPWDINIILLSDKYLEKIKEIEEADFFVSSKVLLAASLLLRIKSEILLNRYIKSIDEILFGKKEYVKTSLERIELEDEIPELIPRSPMPRFKKVTLKELMESLNKAIVTENRRIKKEIVSKNTFRESSFSLPKRKFSIKIGRAHV